jgi:hypothetical protein
MKSVVKNSFYSVIWLSLIGLNDVALAAISLDGSAAVDEWIKWTSSSLDVVLKNWLTYLVWFLYFIAIAMMIYWAFNIITAGWAEDKVKKGKTILIQAVAWLIVVFIANSIIVWLINGLFGAAGA